MRDVLPSIENWLADGQQVALATVVKVWGSAPRPLGAKMACASGGGIAGSVSGGCVEGAVVEAAKEVMATGRPALLQFGVDDDTAFSFGLSCGGDLEVFLERLPSPTFAALAEALRDEVLCARVRVLATDDRNVARDLLLREGQPPLGTLGDAHLDRTAEAQWREQHLTFAPRRTRVELDDAEFELFIDVQPPRPQLIVVGAVHAAIALVHFANLLGFRTAVIDPRTAFATPERFGHAEQLRHEWPDKALEKIGVHANTFVALLSHDPKLDVPAAKVALARGARYVGALGSRKTHQRRVAKLREAGVPDTQIERLHNPIGLDLGGRRAEEIALAVMAQIVAVSHGLGAHPA
jgi:xanthine dehydrogenase accessory factor